MSKEEKKRNDFPTLPALVGKHTYIRSATAEDIAQTHHWFLHSNPEMLTDEQIDLETASAAAEAFKKEEKGARAQRFVIVRQKDNMPVGRVRFFDLNTMNRSTRVDMLVDPEERRKGYALEATRLLCNYLYRHRGLNKIYAQVCSLNGGAVKLLEEAGFKRDGVLRHQYYVKGELHDGFLYSMLLYEFDA